MTNEERVALLRTDVEQWNRFTEENPEAVPSLQGANLARLCLRGANLQDADLSHTDLTGADLRETDLHKANLTQANLQQADLRGADLREAALETADLTGARLRDANLQNANLQHAKGFRSGQLGGANLTGAILPEAVSQFDALANVEKLSQSAKKLFVAMLGACVYCWLTIATTTDVRLITNSASSPLPIIQTPVPIVGFYVAAPLLILCLYLYFHFYLQRLWEGLAELPAFFPDGAPLDKKAHPWLLNGLVRSHFALLKKDRPALSRLQVGLASLLAWWTVPLTLFLFWWRYLVRHDLPITVLQIALLVFSIGAAVFLSRLAARTLSGAERSTFVWEKAYKDARTYQRAAVGVGLAITFLFLFQVSKGAIEGTNEYFFRVPPWVVETNNYFVADLADADVSTKPEGWTGRKEDEAIQIALVKGARLSGRNLRRAFAFRAFLVKADLSFANLQRASFWQANLQGANLAVANLQGANLEGANLQGANLTANLQGANLWDANLQGANLRQANLQRANLRRANLQGANLAVANLQGADLEEANLQGASLEYAHLQGSKLPGAHLQGAKLLNANLEGVNLEDAHLQGADLSEANLQGGNLSGADLQGALLFGDNLQRALLFGANLQKAYLTEARLQGADLSGANLQDAFLLGADFQGTDLRGARELDAMQVKTAANWERAVYGDDLRKKLGLPPDHNVGVFKMFPKIYHPDGTRKQP